MPASRKGFNNKFLHIVEQTIAAYRMFQPGDSALVAVSGGPDSVALLHALCELAPRFSLKLAVAHLNHGLRKKDSDQDAEFVESLARDLQLPCVVQKSDVRQYQRRHKLSLEEAARHVRYAFLHEAANVGKCGKIALGHQADDTAELILMYLFRGSGPLGISGMPPVRDGKIVRPLIQLTRAEIIDFLSERGLKYIMDASNADTRFLRNRIRQHLIPMLQTSYNPGIIRTLNRLAAIVRCEEEWAEQMIDPVFEESVSAPEADTVALSIPKLAGIHLAVKRRIIRKALIKIKGDLRRISFSHIESVVALMEGGSTSGKLDFPDRIRVRRNKDRLTFSKETYASGRRPVPPGGSIEGAESIHFEYRILKPEPLFIRETGMRLEFSETRKKLLPDLRRAGSSTAFFDMDRLNFPLVVRNFRPGDRFTPLGMPGAQKVKKFFINNKIPRTARARCPMVLSQGKIIWVAGYRIDDAVKVMPLTRNVLKAELFLA